MQANRTGIFFVNAGAGSPHLREFPAELRSRLFSSLDGRYLLLLGACALIMGGSTLLLSLRELPSELSEREILRIQERYAQLVLNQPRPTPPERLAEGRAVEPAAVPREQEAPREEIDREKESFTQRRERRSATAESRRRERESIAAEVASAGIFAAITSTGGRGGGQVSDLLGATAGVGGLGDVPVSAGSFATRGVDTEHLQARTGERTSGVGIERAAVTATAGREIASAGGVTVTTTPAEFTTETPAAGGARSCIFSIISRQTSRLRRAYENWLKREPGLAGRLRVRLTILPSGAVTGVTIVQSTMNSPQFEETVVRYVRQWRFESCSIAEPIEIEQPFAFEGLQ